MRAKKTSISFFIFFLLIFTCVTGSNAQFGNSEDVISKDVNFDVWGIIESKINLNVDGVNDVYSESFELDERTRKYNFGFRSNVDGVVRLQVDFGYNYCVSVDVLNYNVTIGFIFDDIEFSFYYNWSDIIDSGFGTMESFDAHNFTQIIVVDNCSVNQEILIDPTFGYTTAGSLSHSISNVIRGGKYTFVGGDNQYAYNITVYVSNQLTLPTTYYKCALYWANNGTYIEQTEQLQSLGLPIPTQRWRTFQFDEPVKLVNNTAYYIVAFGTGGHLYYNRNFGAGWRMARSNLATYPTWDNVTWLTALNIQYSIYCTYDDVPNECPVQGANGTTNFSYYLENEEIIWSINLSDDSGNFSYNISCNVSGEWFYSSDTFVGNGIYNITLRNLTYDENYIIWVNITDGICWTNQSHSLNLSNLYGDYMEIDLATTTMSMFLTLLLFFFFFWIGYTINKRSAGAFFILSGFLLIALEFLAVSYLDALYVIPLLTPFAVFIIILGIRKWLYPAKDEKSKTEGTQKYGG